jgi:hypothetical protein
MNKEALLRLADKLDGIGPYTTVGPVPREVFDLLRWRGAKREACGTPGCAIGHACMDPWFNERGLGWDEWGLYPCLYNVTGGNFIRVTSNWNAIKRFFDVPLRHTHFLFGYDWYPETPPATPAMVAARVRRYVSLFEGRETEL